MPAWPLAAERLSESRQEATEILPGLWIGDAENAMDRDWLKKKQVTAVINCTVNQDFAQEADLKHALRISVRDNRAPSEIVKMSQYLPPVVEKLHEWLSQHNVLVHCRAGRQRSSSVVVAYLMRYGALSLDDAIMLLRSKRPSACKPSCNFYESLQQFTR